MPLLEEVCQRMPELELKRGLINQFCKEKCPMGIFLRPLLSLLRNVHKSTCTFSEKSNVSPKFPYFNINRDKRV